MMASNVLVDLRRSCPSWGLLQQGLHPRQLLGLLGQPSLLLLGQAEGSGVLAGAGVLRVIWLVHLVLLLSLPRDCQPFSMFPQLLATERQWHSTLSKLYLAAS